jgi:hypothetical protein
MLLFVMDIIISLQEVEKNDDRVKDMEQEIECPRCANMMTLSSEFDRLGYLCQDQPYRPIGKIM